jgi:lipopolysaccharide heptosyltransferase II
MSLPFLEAIKSHFPQALVDWAVEEPGAAILDNHPLVNQTLISPGKKPLKPLRKLKILTAFRDVNNYRKKIRENKYDLVFDLQGLFKSGLVCFWAKSPRKIGFSGTREFSPLFLNDKLPRYNPELNASLRYLLLAKHVGANLPPHWELKPTLVPSADDLFSAQKLLTELPQPIISLVIGTRWPSKLWPTQNWAELLKILASHKIGAILLGSPEEIPLETEILRLVPPSESIRGLTGITPLKLLPALFKLTKLTVTADNGSMHLSAAVGAKTLALFGPTRPTRTAPVSPWVTILRSEIKDCLGCLKHQCPKRKEPSCMEDLLPETVFSKIKESLLTTQEQKIQGQQF